MTTPSSARQSLQRPSSSRAATTARRAARMSKPMQMPSAVKSSQEHTSGTSRNYGAVEAALEALVEATALDGAALAIAVPASLHEALQALGLGDALHIIARLD